MASVAIIDLSEKRSETISRIDYPKSKISGFVRLTKIQEVLPFRVMFTNIGIPPANAGIPGIGLQIIGINNYIL
jgi:hypothetical protein